MCILYIWPTIWTKSTVLIQVVADLYHVEESNIKQYNGKCKISTQKKGIRYMCSNSKLQLSWF